MYFNVSLNVVRVQKNQLRKAFVFVFYELWSRYKCTKGLFRFQGLGNWNINKMDTSRWYKWHVFPYILTRECWQCNVSLRICINKASFSAFFFNKKSKTIQYVFSITYSWLLSLKTIHLCGVFLTSWYVRSCNTCSVVHVYLNVLYVNGTLYAVCAWLCTKVKIFSNAMYVIMIFYTKV